MGNNLFSYDEDEKKNAENVQNSFFPTPAPTHDTTMPINRQHEQPQKPKLQDQIAAQIEALKRLQNQGE